MQLADTILLRGVYLGFKWGGVK